MKREQILTAAQRHFSHYGFSKVTMNDIAAEIGMGKTSLYYYFPTKEELYQAVLTRKHEAFLRKIDRVVNSSAPSAKKLRSYVAMRMDYFQEVMNLNLVDLHHWHSLPPQLKITFRKFADEEFDILQAIMMEGCRRGEFSLSSVDKSARALLQIIRGVICQFLRAIEGPQVPTNELQTLKQEMFYIADLFLRGIQTRHS